MYYESFLWVSEQKSLLTLFVYTAYYVIKLSTVTCHTHIERPIDGTDTCVLTNSPRYQQRQQHHHFLFCSLLINNKHYMITFLLLLGGRWLGWWIIGWVTLRNVALVNRPSVHLHYKNPQELTFFSLRQISEIPMSTLTYACIWE